jgi:hypothetical protein
MSPARIERMLATALLSMLGPGSAPVDEKTVLTALQPAPFGPTREPDVRRNDLRTMLLTGTHFVVDMRDFAAIESVHLGSGEMNGLPRLPAQRVWIEFLDPTGRWPRPGCVTLPAEDGSGNVIDQDAAFWGFAIADTEPDWRVIAVMSLGSKEGHYFIGYDILAEGRIVFHDDVSAEPYDSPGHSLLPACLVELITVEGVRHQSVAIPRGHRRAHERKYTERPAEAYFVDLRTTGDPGKSARTGEREYRYRWFVRGHWRRLGPHRRTWVRPHVKGPAGAPWKGRPTYITSSGGVALQLPTPTVPRDSRRREQVTLQGPLLARAREAIKRSRKRSRKRGSRNAAKARR